MDYGKLSNTGCICYADVCRLDIDHLFFSNLFIRKYNRFPLVMNIIQFWIVDTIVKHKTRPLQLRDEEDNTLISDGEYEDDIEQTTLLQIAPKNLAQT